MPKEGHGGNKKILYLNVVGVVACIVIISLLTTSGEESIISDTSKYGFEGTAHGWEAKITGDSQAITAVARSTDRAKYGSASLKCTVNLSGGHTTNSKGEAFVNMQNNPPSGVTIPLNLSNATVSVWVWVPSDAVGNPSDPNSLQLFFKDATENWRSKFASERYIGTDVPTGQWAEITVNTATEVWEYDAGCDLSQVRAVGVKIGAGNQGFSGTFLIDAFDW